MINLVVALGFVVAFFGVAWAAEKVRDWWLH